MDICSMGPRVPSYATGPKTKTVTGTKADIKKIVMRIRHINYKKKTTYSIHCNI